MTTDWLLFDAVRAEAEYRAEQMRGGDRGKAVVPVRRRLPWRRRTGTTTTDIPRPRPGEQAEEEKVAVAHRRNR